MNLSENLKRIRKENNLSQEQLADKLGVSRQSVSKWESNQAYPEMDKVLQICKMFNLNIDELLNQNLKEVNEIKQSKNNINKFVDDFLDYITKSIDMFSCMKFKDKMKCLFEQFIIVATISLVLLVVGEIILNSVWSILSFLPDTINYMFYNIISDIYLLLCLVLGISLVLHIFKVRYLDYYVIIKEDKTLNKEIEEESTKEIKKDNKNIFSKQKETIIIREPKHSSYKFISSLVKCILMLLKFLVILIGIAFCISLIILFDAITLSFLFIETGLLFTGTIIVFISCVIINLIILNMIYNFIVNKKSKSKILSIIFVVSLIMLGIGSGLFIMGFKDFKYIDSLDNSRYIKSEEIIKMKDNLYFLWLDEDDYIETNSNEIKLVFTYSKHQTYEIYENDNGRVEIWFNDNTDIFEIAKDYISDINSKTIVDYYNYEVKIYTSKKNIEKLKRNRDEYYNKQEYYN